jgi:hypothetical protein
MEQFEYKVLWNRRHGLREDWYDGEENLGGEVLLAAAHAGRGDEASPAG